MYMYMYVYVYMYIYIYIYIYMYAHTYIHTCIHTCIHTYMHACIIDYRLLLLLCAQRNNMCHIRAQSTAAQEQRSIVMHTNVDIGNLLGWLGTRLAQNKIPEVMFR